MGEMKNRKKIVVFASIVLCFLLCYFYQTHHDRELYYKCNDADDNMQIVTELYEGVVFEQVMVRPIGNIRAISINVPTFQREDIDGFLQFDIFNNGQNVASKTLDASTIRDGEQVRIDFNVKDGEVGDELKIVISASSSFEKAIGIWGGTAKNAELLKPYMNIDGEKNLGITNMSIIYEDCKLSYVWWLFVGYLLVICVIAMQSEERQERYKKNKFFVYAFLFTVAVGILCLRGGVFSFSALYAEDGLYLSNIIETGFLRNCFRTRLGGSGDIYNTGSYILLEIAWLLNKAFNGFNLEHLPLVIGIVSSVFWAFIAILAYHIFSNKGKMLGTAVYAGIILVPVGISTMEIFGRVLNEVFIFPVLAILLLVYLWDKRYNTSIKNYLCEILILICCMSFPISFGALGIWLIIGIYCSIREEKGILFIRSNAIKIVTILIGMLLLPTMMGSEGASAGLETNSAALIEFFIGRHMLYLFVYLLYNYLNDALVVVLFLATMLIIVAAIVSEYRKEKKFGSYFVLVCMGMGCILASAIMRLPMSSWFGNYQSTYPDRYYYGCNILYCIMVLYGLFIILKDKQYKLHVGILVIFVMMLMMNTNLFPEMDKDTQLIKGASNGIEDWKECIEAAATNNRIEDGKYLVEIYPFREYGTIIVKLPAEYVWASIE